MTSKRKSKNQDDGATDIPEKVKVWRDTLPLNDSVGTGPEPVARVEPKLDPKPAVIPVDPTVPNLPKIRIQIFEKIAGPKWDQLAGFKQHAKTNKLGPMTVPEWRTALQAFRGKPTKSTR